MDLKRIISDAILIALTVIHYFPGKADCNVQDDDLVVKKPLYCLECYGSDTTTYCQDLDDNELISTTRCLPDEEYCMVKRMETNGELTTFSRQCVNNCTSGCTTVGTTYRITECYSCCQDNLCNKDNSGNSQTVHGAAVNIMMLTSVCLLIWRYTFVNCHLLV